MNIAIMIIWLGTAHTGLQIDVERFNSLAECEAAKAVIPIPADAIRCIEVPSGEEQ